MASNALIKVAAQVVVNILETLGLSPGERMMALSAAEQIIQQ